MTDKEASEYLSSKKISHCTIKRIPEGANHFVFDVKLDNGKQAVAKNRIRGQHERNSLSGGLFSDIGRNPISYESMQPV